MAVLEIKDLTKRFGGVVALSNVNINVNKKDIFALVGPNGSGKTTCLNCINGLYKPTKGLINFEGKNITGISPHKAISLGIGRTFQNIELFPNMKVIENVMVGLHSRIRAANFFKIILKGEFRDAWEWSRDESFEKLDLLGIASFHNRIVNNLPYGLLKLVELARALASNPKLLLLDEPSAGMNEQESVEILKIIKEIRDILGLTIILIEHNMKLVMNVSDRICVLNNGELIAEGIPSVIRNDPKVIEAFWGRE